MHPRLFIAMLAIVPIFCSANGPTENEYNIGSIPADLLKNAIVVKRKEEIRFEILDAGKAREVHRYALTILNENGAKYASCHEYYDRLRSVESIEGTLYDAFGKKIRSLKKSEIQDLSATSDNNLIDDYRIKAHDFFYRSYPYTVEYEVALKYNATMFFPGWEPMEEEQYFAVQQSKITVVTPTDYQFRYKAFNLPQGPVQEDLEKNHKSFTWEIKNQPAIALEYASPRWNEITPELYLGPTDFKIEGYEGNMQTWQDFGKFVYSLKAGRDQLPDNIKAKVAELTKNIADPKEKIARLYEFMQQNTHYISIQLGIGGWQPFDANYVATKRYGDCKALANYMYALLKEAGIKSYYTLIHAGMNQKYLATDFPSSQFNHVIVCVPLPKDTVWLECTDQTLPAGYLSSFTHDRYALLIDESGGTLVRTPRYSYHQNLENRKTVANLSAEGNLKIQTRTTYRAIAQDQIQGMLAELSKDRVLQYLKTVIDLPTYDVDKFDYQQQKSDLPVITENLEITASNYAQVSGKRIFINPNILNRSNRHLEPDESRKFDVVLNNEFRDQDSAEITLPQGYTPEAIPKPVSLETPFGKYQSQTSISGDRITYYRFREQYGGRFPANQYSQLVDFYEKMYKADQSQVVLVKKQ